MAVVAGCQEVQGACLEGCLGKACGGFGGFGGFEGGQTAALNALKNRWPWCLAAKRCKGPARKVAFGKEGLEVYGGQTAALNAIKNRWPWCLAAKRCKGRARRVALERRV